MLKLKDIKDLNLPDDVIVIIDSSGSTRCNTTEMITTVKKCYDYEKEIPEDYRYQKKSELKTRFGGTCYVIEYFCIVIGKHPSCIYNEVSFEEFMKG